MITIEPYLIAALKFIQSYPLLSTALPVWLIFAFLFFLRPIFSSLYGPLVRTYNYNTTQQQGFREITKGVFRLFTTFFLTSFMFAFTGSLGLLLSNLQHHNISISDVKEVIVSTGHLLLSDGRQLDINQYIVKPIQNYFTLFGMAGIISVAAARILAVMYNTYSIANILNIAVTTSACLSVVAVFQVHLLTILTDTVKLAFYDGPFTLFKLSLYGFLACESILHIMPRKFRKARLTPFFLQRQRHEIFELQEQFFSRPFLLEKWVETARSEISKHGLEEINWISFSFTREQVECIIEATKAYELKKNGTDTNTSRIMKRAVRLITSEDYYNSYMQTNGDRDPNKLFTTLFSKHIDQSTFTTINGRFVFVTLPCPHERIRYLNQLEFIHQSSNVAFLSLEPERVYYYSNRFSYQWNNETRFHCCENFNGLFDKYITDKSQARLLISLLGILASIRVPFDRNTIVSTLASIDGNKGQAQGTAQSILEELIDTLAQNGICWFTSDNRDQIMGTHLIGPVTDLCLQKMLLNGSDSCMITTQ